MNVVVVYVTAASRDEAIAIGRAVVDERLAACANVLPPITSVFRWEGVVQEQTETSLLLKTRTDLVERLTDRVRELHSYTCPCVVALNVVGGHSEFLDWIVEETTVV